MMMLRSIAIPSLLALALTACSAAPTSSGPTLRHETTSTSTGEGGSNDGGSSSQGGASSVSTGQGGAEQGTGGSGGAAPQCVTDADCTAPDSMACVRVQCVAGTCETRPLNCDDGDSGTSDHCCEPNDPQCGLIIPGWGVPCPVGACLHVPASGATNYTCTPGN